MMRFQRTWICQEGWYYIAVLAFVIGGAVLREINLLMFVAGIIIGPLLLSWRLVYRSLQKLEVKRHVPIGVGAGERFDVQLTVENRKRRLHTWGLVVTDRLTRVAPSAGGGSRDISTFFPFLAAGASQAQSYQGRVFERGEYRVGPLQLATRFPLGLLHRALPKPITDTFYVYPRMGRLTRHWSQVTRQSRMGNQRSQNRRGPLEGEFHSLRRWRSGDSRRWIHWRTSARRNELTVRQFERRQNRDLTLLVELPGGNAAGLDAAREKVVRFAATVVAHQCRHGSSRLLLGIAGGAVAIVSGATSSGLLQEAMEKLAVAEGGRKDRLPELLKRSFDEGMPTSRSVIVSTRPVDITDTDRFSAVWDDPGKRSFLRRILCLNVNDPEFTSYFEDTGQELASREESSAAVR